MDTHSCKSISIDLFNLPPLPNEWNKEESYMDVPYHYYIPNGKNSRLLDRTYRVEFDRETIEGNTGFQLKIPYLEYAFGTKHFVMDKITGSMMGIYDDKVEQIDLKGQLKPFNINQLDRVMHIIGQRRLGLDTSSILMDEIPEDSQIGTVIKQDRIPLEQTDADQIIQTVNEEVTSTNKEMQVIMQSDNKHPHINKSGSFSRFRSFKLNDMGFSLNKISPITFDVKNPQTPVDRGTKGRAPTSTPRERRVSWITQQGQTHDGVANLNEAHHEPQGNTSYNPDESITNKHVKGRFIPPKVGNTSTQPQQQQQSSSEEGSKENTILNGPRHHKKGVLRVILKAQQTACHKDQPLQHLHIHHKLEDHHRLPQSTIRTEITRIHQNTMEPPVDPPEHLWIVKVQELLKEGTRCQNLTLEHHQVQVLLHSMPNHLRTLFYVQHVAKVAIGA